MRSGSADRLLPLGLTLATVVSLAACTPFDRSTVEVPAPVVPAVDSAIADALALRARAVRTRDQPDFLDGIDTDERGFRRNQSRLFDNLQELPLEAFDYELEAVTQLPDGRVEAALTQRMQLRGYDSEPVQTPSRFIFRKVDGRWVLDADHDHAFDIDHDIHPQPWELTRIEAEQHDGVLGIFDAGSIDAAYQIMPAVSDGIADISARIPLTWSHRVVVYALSDTAMMASLDDLPGGDPERLEGVAFGVPAAPGTTRLAGMRFMLHPRVIDQDDDRRDRLIRHELTHVAIGTRDDHVPTWLAEGLAEWVSVQAVPRAEREISREAFEMAQAGITALPADADFNGVHSQANYGISWYVCEFIARKFGPETVWRLLAQMDAGSGTPEADQDKVLLAVLGMRGDQLAAAAGRQIVRTFT
jgi:hypothetical protein